MTSKKNPDNKMNRLIVEKKEQNRQLAAINQINNIIKEDKSVENTLQQICFFLPKVWQYPEFTVVKIRFEDKEYVSSGFRQTSWGMTQRFRTKNNKHGCIDIFYLKKFPTFYEGPFLKEERSLINKLANILEDYINGKIDRESGDVKKSKKTHEGAHVPVTDRKLLQNFLNKNNADRDIYHDLMPFKVKEILLVANLYDAYNIEREGGGAEQIFGEYYQLSLTTMPRITGVSTINEAKEQLETKHFDMIIIMVGVDKKTPIEVSQKIKKIYPYISIFLLLNNDADIVFFEEKRYQLTSIDKIFVWNGESKVFFAMVKSLEDKVNADNDTRIGLARIILLVEDSAKYYSRYMPMLYHSVLEQTQRIIDDVSTDEQYKMLGLRARPKILLASNFEEAMEIYERFREYLLCLISDVKFERNGVLDENAGVSLVSNIKDVYPNLPVIIQSANISNEARATELNCNFIDKKSETLNQDIKKFIRNFLGFGNFVYRDAKGNKIATAKSFKEFEEHLHTAPAESLLYHANKNHFSLWLMARGEIRAARMIAPYKISDFKSSEEVRDYLVYAIQNYRNEKKTGKIVEFNEDNILDEHNIIALATGSLGGKGRGLAFINSMLHNLDLHRYFQGINVKSPRTSVIGIDEYESFLERNNILEKIQNVDSFEEKQHIFLQSNLSEQLIERLRIMLKNFHKPLAIRSSGLFEDSLLQPVAGIFQTYLLPNSNPNLEKRLKQVTDAIKLVYVSVFSDESRANVEALNYKIEEEKMAVVVQEVVGNQYNSVFYPHISGVAQSYNYYPFAHMKPEEGFAVAAVGLGKYVVDGEKAFRFSPVFPTLKNFSIKGQVKNTQVEFYAVDLAKKELNLLEGETAGLIRLDVDEAEKHGNLKHCASVYNPANDTITPGLDVAGPRIINFANIMKHNYIPLAKTIEGVLDIIKEAMGSPIEIEFAVDLNKDDNGKASFYLLQIKPLIGNIDEYNVDLDKIDRKKLVLAADKSMGNGLIDNIVDVVYVDQEEFEKQMTVDIAQTISHINSKMREENRRYILIGPGRWGTRDRWIGIPVRWADIFNAKLIVETSFEDYPLEASSGSHFFHNVTSMNIGYCSVQYNSDLSFIDYEIFKNQELINNYGAVRHIRFKKPLTIKMDGKKRISVVTFNE